MPLVNYDVSDDEEQSENEDNGESQIKTTELPHKIEKSHESTQINKLFTKLPPPKASQSSSASTSTSTLITPSLSDFVVSDKSKGMIKISAPSVKDYDDIDDDELNDRKKPKRFKPSETGTALTSLLPKPKNVGILGSSRTLVPQSVVRPKPNLPPPKQSPKIVKSSQMSPKIKDTVDDDTDTFGDFFFLSDDTKSDKSEAMTDHSNAQSIETIESFSYNKNLDIAPQTSEYEHYSYVKYGPELNYPQNISSQSSSLENPSVNDVTYKKLIASKFGEETADEIQIVDVDVSKHLSKSNDWLKTVSEEREAPYEGEAPNSTARRKHQITYLAFQAKQREVELKNQWAANRLTKSQTRAKYGF